jgi:hypothetical protein
MAGLIHRILGDDHVRLDGLLAAAARPGAIDLETYDRFAAGLFRPIAMEDKVLLPEAARRQGGAPLAIERRLRADHAALGALLVPPPTHDLVSRIRAVLSEHNPLEEGPGGLYETCERLFGPEAPAILARLEAVKPMRAPRHLDGPRFWQQIETLMRARVPKPGSDSP